MARCRAAILLAKNFATMFDSCHNPGLLHALHDLGTAFVEKEQREAIQAAREALSEGLRDLAATLTRKAGNVQELTDEEMSQCREKLGEALAYWEPRPKLKPDDIPF